MLPENENTKRQKVQIDLKQTAIDKILRRRSVDMIIDALRQRRAAMRIEPVPSPNNNGIVCTFCHEHKLIAKVTDERTKAYSNVAAKRKVRAAFVEFVRRCLANAGDQRLLVFIVDHFLPFTDDEPSDQGSYLTDDLLVADTEPICTTFLQKSCAQTSTSTPVRT
jgi:hypothetical protein